MNLTRRQKSNRDLWYFIIPFVPPVLVLVASSFLKEKLFDIKHLIWIIIGIISFVIQIYILISYSKLFWDIGFKNAEISNTEILMDSKKDTIFMSFWIYILMLCVFASIYIIIEIFTAGSFNVNCKENTIINPVNAVYFSTITAATIGYGDITPITPIAKIFVTLEVILSFIYGVTIISRLVGIEKK